MDTTTVLNEVRSLAAEGNGHAQSGPHRPSGGPIPLRVPTLKEAVAALPERASGHLSRERMRDVLESGEATEVLLCCLDELSLVRGLVEVLRVAATEAEAPIRDTRNGIDALADLVRDQLGRLQVLLRGAMMELGSPSERPESP